MSGTVSPSVSFTDLTFDWPDGSPALTQLTGTFTPGRTGLVGDNGSGKSTLLKLIAGILTPASGQIVVSGEVGYLPQTLTLDAETTVAELLGIAETLGALKAIEAGDVDERHFETVGDDWDVEARSGEALAAIGLSSPDLDRAVGELSGGQSMLVALTGLQMRRTPITLLDEPTNNLDRAARTALIALVERWPGTLVVVSHDRELLEHLQVTAELHQGRLSSFGGPYSAWHAQLDREQDAAAQAARTAEQALDASKRQRIAAETKLARRDRTARKTQQSGGIPRIVAGNRASKAQGSAGALRTGLESRTQAAQAAVDAADARVRDDEHIHLTLPDPAVARSRRIAELVGSNRTVVIQGPERVVLTGANGTGKTALLEHLVNSRETPGCLARGVLLTDRVGYLPQRLDGLDDRASALENVRAAAPALSPGDIRNQLARLLIRGDSVDRPVETLSGGERFRVSIARLLLADPPAQLLVLDEPTNNLDIRSVDQLIEALLAYRGALLVVSHDAEFVAAARFDVVLELDAEGALHERRLG